jgi:GT2 family glycosyltransferase/glycosyltransferase involved in cell wall biosynthesis/Tfp pilus assembly protein PilF
MNRDPSPLADLARLLAAEVADAGPVLVAAPGGQPLIEALTEAGVEVVLPGPQAAGPFAAAVLLAPAAAAGSAASLCDDIVRLLTPQGRILWITAPAAQRLRQLLHLPAEPLEPGVAGDTATWLLEAAGVTAEVVGDVDAELDAGWSGIVEAVDAAGGDTQALRRDLSVRYRVLRGRRLRQRPAEQADGAAVRTAVEAALAAGGSVGTRTASAVASPEEERAVPPRVGIVIPVYNGAALTEACLYGIAGNTGDDPDYEVVVVDNGSDDWTMYLLHAMEGDLRVLNNDRNLGFARACNQGADASAAEYVLFLNNDTVPNEGWLEAMVAAADADPAVGIVGARLLYPDGTIQHAGLHMVNGIPDHEFRGAAADDPRVTQTRDLDMVTGACLLIRRELFIELGGFDAQFVNGVEDVDLCLRARERGWRVVYCADAVVEHHEAQSKGRFDHVQENVRRFLERWQGRFDETGRLRVDGAPAANGQETGRAVPGTPSPSGHAQRPATMTPADAAPDTDGPDIVLGAPAEAPAEAPASPRPVAVPAAEAAAPGTSMSVAAPPARLNWEGSFFLHSSLAHVNRELCLALLRREVEAGLLPFEPDQFDPAADDRFRPLVERMGRSLDGVDVHVRHRWPPDLTRPASGRYALMQPWEFGSVPRAWVEAVRDGVVDQVWAYTRYVRDCYVDGGVDPARVAVVPAGIDPQLFRPGLTPHEAVRSDKPFRFLFVGGTLYRKGIDLLLAAWREAFGAQDDVALVIKDMGVGTFYRNQTAGERIRALQQDPGCAEIEYLTQDLPADEIPRIYAAGDALVHPYRGEGFGLPVAEAMACGLPVVLTRGGACDDICPADLGYFVDSRRQPVQLGGGVDVVGQAWQLEADVADLAAQMRRVYEDRPEARRRGAAGSEHVRAHVTWDRAAEAALAAVERLRSGDLDPAPRASLPAVASAAAAPAAGPDAGAASARDTAVVLLGSPAAAEEAAPALSRALGQYHRFAVDTGGGHPLGEQLEAVRSACADTGGVKLLLVLSPEAWDLTADSTAEELQHLRSHFDSTDDLGLLVPGTLPGTGLQDIEYPESSCLFCRLQAIDEVGGFEISFTSTALFANAARALRRKGWRVAAAGDVVVEEPEEAGDVVAFGGSRIVTQEMGAVAAMEQADRRRAAGDVHGAVERYREVLQHKPDFVEAILVLADAHVEARDGDGALEAVQRLVNLDSSSSFSHNYAGLVAARAGKTEAARDSFRRAVELDPDLVDARVNLGVIEWEQRNLDEALEQFREASQRDPFNRELVVNLGLVYGQIDDPAAAVQLYRGYLERNPQDVELTVRLARAELSMGDGEAATRTLRAVLQREPAHDEARTLLKEIAQDLGDDEAAQG